MDVDEANQIPLLDVGRGDEQAEDDVERHEGDGDRAKESAEGAFHEDSSRGP